MSVHRTFCRLCEVGCGLVADVDGGRITRLRPDHEHPVTAGFACKKGLVALDVHHDPDRLDVPLARTADGFTPASWDDALAGIGASLRSVIDRWGPSAVAIYIGNPTAFNASAQVGMGLFALGFGGARLFSSGTQDCANKFAVAEVLYGSMQVHPIPDFEHTHHALVLGSNPRVSGGSFVQLAPPVDAMRSIVDRGGSVRFVNPVVVEPAIGETVQVKPDTDAYLLAAMLHEIDRTVGFDVGPHADHVRNIDAVRSFVAAFPPARVATVVGVPAETIIGMAREFAAAPTACAHMSTGVNMGRQGALAYWLLQMLVLVTGNLDRRGGNYVPRRGLPARAYEPPADDVVSSPWGDYHPAGSQLPGALLADMIESPDDPVRALIVLSGNPVLTMTGSDRLVEALRSLDLLVSLDIYRNATAELAHFVLPCTDQFERTDLNTFVQGMQSRPFVQWTDRVVEPAGERRDEFRIFGDLLRAIGREPLLPPDTPDPIAVAYDHALASVGLSVDALRAADGGTAVLDGSEPGHLFSDEILTLDGMLDCLPPSFASTLERAHRIFDELAAEPPSQRKLIARRTRNTLNSWFANVDRLRDPSGGNPLHVHPDDAADLGVTDGCAVRVWNDNGALVVTVRVDASLRPGVVAMTHGFGHAASPALRVAHAHPGVNVNVLTPAGAGSFDPFGGMSHLTGVPVEVAPVAG